MIPPNSPKMYNSCLMRSKLLSLAQSASDHFGISLIREVLSPLKPSTVRLWDRSTG